MTSYVYLGANCVQNKILITDLKQILIVYGLKINIDRNGCKFFFQLIHIGKKLRLRINGIWWQSNNVHCFTLFLFSVVFISMNIHYTYTVSGFNPWFRKQYISCCYILYPLCISCNNYLRSQFHLFKNKRY